MAVNKGEIGIYGKLVNDTPEGVLAGAEQILDSNLNKDQETINREVNAKVEELDSAVKNVDRTLYKVVTSLPEDNIDDTKIYLVPSKGEEGDDYEEYGYINGKWEFLGRKVSIDLSGYLKKTDTIEADKLKTPVMLWGQEFDGSKNVSGNINLGEEDYIICDSYSSSNDLTLMRYYPWSGILEIGEETKEIILVQSTTCIKNITAPNITEIENKLEDVTKVADDSQVIKGFFDVVQGTTAKPNKGIIYIDYDDGLKCSLVDNTIVFTPDTDYLATKEDLEDKANDNEVVKGLQMTSTGQNVLFTPNTSGNIALNYSNGLKITKGSDSSVNIQADTNVLATKDDLIKRTRIGDISKKLFDAPIANNEVSLLVDNTALKAELWQDRHVLFSIDTNYISTREYVDDKINFLVNSEGELEDSFDTLKEVDTWIKSHESEAADIISRQNLIEEWKGKVSKFRCYDNFQCDFVDNGVWIRGRLNNFAEGTSYSGNSVVTIPNATAEHNGVMSATDKQTLDTLAETSATKEELNTLSTELENAVIAEEVIDEDTFEDIDKVTREELEKDLFVRLWKDKFSFNRNKNGVTLLNLSDYDKEKDVFLLDGEELSFEDAIRSYGDEIKIDDGTAIGGKNYKGKAKVLAVYVYGEVPRLDWLCAGCVNLEIVRICNYNTTDANKDTQTIKMLSTLRVFESCENLREVRGIINLTSDSNIAHFEAVNWLLKLESIKLYGVIKNIPLLFKLSPYVTLTTFQYLVDNAANTTPITITVHADVYAKLTDTGNTEWNALNTLALSKQITFATA